MDMNIPFIVPIIVSLVSPEQIILFGSYARGDNTEKSDIDLLIIKKGLKNGREINNLLYMAFFEEKIDVPVDLISIDYNKYIELNNKLGYIYKTIKEQGKILYGVEPEFTHSISILLTKLEKHVEIPDNIKKSIELTNYAVQTKYPCEYDDVTKEEYDKSVKIAKNCLDWVESKINQ